MSQSESNKKQIVRLFYRKPRASGNYSIETSFNQMLAHFPSESDFKIEKFVSSYFSNSLLPRLLACWEAYQNRAAINHITGDIHFLTLAFTKKRTILTIHDCGFMEHPSKLARVLLKLFWLDLPVQSSKYVTTVSEATKQEVIRYTNCNPDKIIVIPTIINELYQASTKPFNSICPTILHIGTAFNKNLERHAKALEGVPCHLHIIGKITDEHRKIFEELKIDFHSEYNISDEKMLEAYHKADILLFASTLEGFGMPIVEAQAVGRPVVTSNCSSMPEVAGGGASLVDPMDVDSIRAGILRIIEDQKYREFLVNKGFENVKRFRAEEIAKQYEALYEKMLNR